MTQPDIFNLEGEGSYIYVHSDKLNIYLLYENFDDNKIYQLTLDKYFTITNVEEVHNCLQLIDNRDIIFTKPSVNKTNDIVFKGFYKHKETNVWIKFNIENYSLNEEGEIVRIDRLDLKTFKNLEHFDVDYYIQSVNTIFFVGYDRDRKETVYVRYNMTTAEIEYYSSMFSDTKDFYLRCLSVDRTNNFIYKVGHTVDLNTNKTTAYFQIHFNC